MTVAWAWAELADLTPWLLRFTVAGTLVTAFAHVLGSTALRSLAIVRVDAWRTTVVALLMVPALSVALPGRWTLPGPVLLFEPFVGELVRSEHAPLPGVGTAEAVPPADTGPGPRVDVALPLPATVAAGSEAVLAAAAGAPALPARDVIALQPTSAIAVLWLGVTSWFLFQLVAGIVALNIHARRAKNVTWEVLHLLPAAAKRRGRHVQVLRGGPFRVPVCWGVLRPRILLPFGSGGWTQERLRAVLLHEAAHVERRDGLFLILARVACALHWLNPLAWGLLRRLSVDAEAACDSAVLRAGVPARYYARVLVDVASEARRSRRPDAAMALALLRTGTLTWRVTRILDPRSTVPVRRWVTTSAVGFLLLVTIAGATVTLEAENAPAGLPAAERVLDQPLRGEVAAPARVSVPKATPEELAYQEPEVLRRPSAARSGADTEASVRPLAIDVPELTPPSPSASGAELLRSISGMGVASERLTAASLDLPIVQPAPELPKLDLTTRRAPILSGKLFELGSDRPVPRANLLLLNERYEVVSGVVTDLNGAFAVRVPGPGEFHLTASAFGYRETTMGVSVPDGDLAVEFPIQPSPLPVSGLVVEREAALNSNGFSHRMRTAIGRFFSPEEIAGAQALAVTDLLLGMPRLNVVPGSSGKRVLMTGSAGQCSPRIYVDGMLVSTDGRELDRMVPLSALEAMEVYQSGAQVPLQWSGTMQTDSSCGAIVAWTKK